jgi:class 3 adenylate cyclase
MHCVANSSISLSAARAGMAHLDAVRQAQGLPPLPFGAALHLGEILWGNIGAADRPRVWLSDRGVATITIAGSPKCRQRSIRC